MCSQDPTYEKALNGIDLLQKLNSSELEDTGSLGGGSELEDEEEDILLARGLELQHALEVTILLTGVQEQVGKGVFEVTIWNQT